MKPQHLVLPVGVALLLLALLTGVFRLLSNQGVMAQPPLTTVFPFHGEIMAFGFLAILLTTERYLGAAAFKLHPVIHLMPFLVTLGAVLKVVGSLTSVGTVDTVGSIAVAVGAALYIYLLLEVSRQSAQPLPFRYMALGGVLLMGAAVISLRESPVQNMGFTLLLLGFPILTIIGERVELSRFLSPTAYRRAAFGLWAAAAAYALLLIEGGDYLVAAWAVLMALVALHLVRSELALVKAGEASSQRLHRYLGRHLVVAYLWFFVGLGLTIAWSGSERSVALYDAATHSLAVGFIGTMILAHAPVIVPALLPLRVDQQKISFLPLVLLTAANLMRVGGHALKGAGLSFGNDVVGFSGLVVLATFVAFLWSMARSLRPA